MRSIPPLSKAVDALILSPRRRRRTGRPRLPHFEALEDRLAPAVFNVPGDFPTLAMALSNGVAVSPDAVNVVVLGPGSFPVVNQKVQPVTGKANASLTIVGQGADVTVLDAHQQGRALELVQGSIALRDLTVTGGLIQGDANVAARGAGILINTAEVSLTGVTVRDNGVLGAKGEGAVAPANPSQSGTPAKPGQIAQGGGIYVGLGSLHMVGCDVRHNSVVGGEGGDGVSAGAADGSGAAGDGGEGAGGGLYSLSLLVNIQDTTFSDNLARGGDGGKGGVGNGGFGGGGGPGLGGGLAVRGTVNVFGLAGPGRPTLFTLNRAVGGDGGNGGSLSRLPLNPTIFRSPGSGGAGGRAQGGGVWIGGARASNFVGVTFANDSATGGGGGPGAAVTASPEGGLSGGDGGDGGAAAGGGLFVIQGAVYGGSLTLCQVTGGNGGKGGDGENGRMNPDPYDVYGNGFSGLPGGDAGDGGRGGPASGGGVSSLALLTMIGTSVDRCKATGGGGGVGANAGDGAPGHAGASYTFNGSSMPVGPNGGWGGPGGAGGAGGRGGDATGGGVALGGTVGTGPFNLVDCSVTNGSVTGGPGASGGNGGQGGKGGAGGLADPAYTYEIQGVVYHGGPGGYGGRGGSGGPTGGGGGGHGYGGGVYVSGGDLVFVSGAISGSATGGPGKNSGNAGGGGAGGAGGQGTGDVHDPSGGGRGGDGGDAGGGDGGNAQGGGLYLNGDVSHATIDPPGLVVPGVLVAGDAGASDSAGNGAPAGNPWLGPDRFEGDTGKGVPGKLGTPRAGVAAGAAVQYGGAAAPPPVAAGPASQLMVSPVPPRVFSGTPIPYPVYVFATDMTAGAATPPHIVSSFNETVDLTVNAPKVDADPVEYDLLGGWPSQKASHGVAVFNDLRVKSAQTQTELIANSPALMPGGTAFKFDVVGYGPDQIRQAYGINLLGKDAKGRPLDGTGQTVAIVVKYHNPRLFDDVDAFDRQYGLDATYGAASSFIAVRNQYGQASPLPGSEPLWASEEVMDVEWVHAIAPGAKILVIEAEPENDYFRGLDFGVLTADSFANGALSVPGFPPVSVVSMSWGDKEASIIESGKNLGLFEDNVDSTAFRTPGVTYVAASGDWGNAGAWPAFSPHVVAVGGTNLWIHPDGSWSSETEWDRSGYGLSLYQTQPDFQAAVRKLGRRSIPDVEFLATDDQGFGAVVYNSYSGPATNPWTVPGGTSLGTPCWAALFAIVNQGRTALGRSPFNAPDGPSALDALYKVGQVAPEDFDDIVSDPTGLAGHGFDLRSGWGSPVANLLVPDLIDADVLRFETQVLRPATVGVPYYDLVGVRSNGGFGPVRVTASIDPPSFAGQFTLRTRVSDTNKNETFVDIIGTPTLAFVATLRVVATDARGTSETRYYTLTVVSPLHIDVAGLAVGVVNRPYKQVIKVTGGEGGKLLQATPASAFGLRFMSFPGDPGKLVIEGTPKSSGELDIVLNAFDQATHMTPVRLRLRVNPALALGTLSKTTWPRNKPGFSAVIPIVGGIGPYRTTVTGLPVGLKASLNAKTGVLTITGKPTQVVNRLRKVTVTAIDATGYRVTGLFTLTITPR